MKQCLTSKTFQLVINDLPTHWMNYTIHARVYYIPWKNNKENFYALKQQSQDIFLSEKSKV